MARSPRSTTSKARAGGKARGASSRSTGSSKKGASKRNAGRARTREGQAQSESWATSIGTLIGSQPGREILAEALDAAAAVLRRERGGQQATGAVNAAAETGANAASSDGG